MIKISIKLCKIYTCNNNKLSYLQRIQDNILQMFILRVPLEKKNEGKQRERENKREKRIYYIKYFNFFHLKER